MNNYINNFLISKKEKRDITNTGTDYEYNYDGYCIKVYIPDSEINTDTQTQLEKSVVESITNHYKKHFCCV